MTDTLRDPSDVMRQIEWEDHMLRRGVDRFMSAQTQAREEGRGDEAHAERRMLSHYLLAVAEGIEAFTEVTQYSHDNSEKQMLRALPSKMTAMLTLKGILSELHNPRIPLAALAQSIGARVEDEIMMQKFHAEHGTYFEEIVRKIDSKHSFSREYKRKSIEGSLRNQKGEQIDRWTTAQRYKLGQRLIHIASQVCDLFEINAIASQRSGGTFIRATDKCLMWMRDFEAEMSIMFPDRMPMLIPPDPWTNAQEGGYITPHLRKMTPLIIKSPMATANNTGWMDLYNNANMPKVYRGINALQDTKWGINDAVLRVLRQVMEKNLGTGVPRSDPYEFPVCPLGDGVKPASLDPTSAEMEAFNMWKGEMRTMHELEAERRAKIVNVSRIIRMAGEMENTEFHYVYRCDFRGRVYCATSGLSPQGTELAKALLRFAEGKPLGERGWYWFRVAGANRYGKDKVSFDDRVKWIDECGDTWKQCAVDPIGTREIWGKADDPYSFLAWCYEYWGASQCRNPATFISHLPIGMDGSCNGLQHFSAMLRDGVGGSAVNLVPAQKPSDIYQRVADVMSDRLRAMPDNPYAVRWLALFHQLGLGGAPRALTKKPVMTLPYGSTERTACDSVMQWYLENGQGFFPKAEAFKHALFLTPILWTSIGDVVIAARAAMAWIRKCAGIVARSGQPLEYTSLLGFPVRQINEKMKSEIITTYLSGRLRIAIDVPTGEIDSLKMQNGSSPNYVHHGDATHMIMSINGMLDEDITSFAMIHDDYGTHACYIEAMHRVIRREFLVLYMNRNALLEFKRQLELNSGCELPDPPEYGTLDLSGVTDSAYFFS
jgi:DNA-directed RNA polymerase